MTLSCSDHALEQSGTRPQWALEVVPEASLSLFWPNRETLQDVLGEGTVWVESRVRSMSSGEIYVVREEGTSRREARNTGQGPVLKGLSAEFSAFHLTGGTVYIGLAYGVILLIMLIDWVVPFPRQDSVPGQGVLVGMRMEKQS